MPAPTSHGEPFVGRADIVSAFLSSLDEAGVSYRLHVRGTWGMGKSALVRELCRRSLADGRVIVCRVTASLYVPLAPTQGAGPIDATTRLRNWEAHLGLLEALASRAELDDPEHLPPCDQLRDLHLTLARERTHVATRRTHGGINVERIETKVNAGGAITASTGAAIGGIVYQEATDPDALLRLQQSIDDARVRVRDACARALDGIADSSGCVFLIDDAERLDGHEAGDWLVDLVDQLRKCIVVWATRQGEPRVLRADERRLAVFSAAEVDEYLRARLGRAPDRSLLERVQRFSAGLPHAVGMAADLLLHRSNGAGLDDLVFDQNTPVTTTLLSTIVAEADPQLAQVLREGRLARRIDGGLIEHILFGDAETVSDEQKEQASLVLKHLLDYSFVEVCDPTDAEGIGRYRFHEYVTRAQAPADDDSLHVDVEAVHERLAEFYERGRDAYDEEQADRSAYLQWYKYEQARWRALTREWLYHTGQLTAAASRTAARLELAQVLLEAFWWWGCYVAFDFVTQLLEDWDRTQPASERVWSEKLRQIVRSYPTGYHKLDRGDWVAVESALRWLRRDAGIEGAVPLASSATAPAAQATRDLKRRKLRAFTSLFLAHCYRFRSALTARAVAPYDDALRYLRAIDDPVAVAWTTFELAELRAELGDAVAAGEGLRASAAQAREVAPDDWELFTNLHRLQADLLFAGGDAPGGVAALGRAVVRAYLYQGRPNPPDPYTVTFYQELRERLADRLATLLRSVDAPTFATLVTPLPVQLAVLQSVPDATTLADALRTSSPQDAWALLTPVPAVVGVSDTAFDDRIARLESQVIAEDAEATLLTS